MAHPDCNLDTDTDTVIDSSVPTYVLVRDLIKQQSHNPIIKITKISRLDLSHNQECYNIPAHKKQNRELEDISLRILRQTDVD